jgi:hypothetical protein
MDLQCKELAAICKPAGPRWATPAQERYTAQPWDAAAAVHNRGALTAGMQEQVRLSLGLGHLGIICWACAVRRCMHFNVA